MCCSTGTCSTDMDPGLVNFVAMRGIKLERYNLDQ